MVALGRGVQAVQRFRGGAGGGGEAKSEIGSNEVVVDGFRNPNHGQSSLGNRSRAAHGAIAANHHQGINPMFFGRGQTTIGGVNNARLSVGIGAVGIPRGSSPVVRAENRATLVKDAGDRISVQGHHPIFHQALVAIQDAHGFNPMSQRGGLDHGPDHGVQPRTIATTGENSNSAWTHLKPPSECAREATIRHDV